MKSMVESGFWSSVPSLVLISLALHEGIRRDKSDRGMGQCGWSLPCAHTDLITATGEVQSSVINYT